MRETGGAVVNVASQLAIAPTGGRAAYVSSKSGVIALTRSLAVEWAPKIRVNAVAPGVTRTAMIEAIERDERTRRSFEERIPLGRFAEPAEIAGAILFLASELSSYVTGHILVADGGYTIS
jgi:3-oxoacyl-[acyl-carrier protein] reductase